MDSLSKFLKLWIAYRERHTALQIRKDISDIGEKQDPT